MTIPKQALWKMGIGVAFIVLGIVAKRLFHAGAFVMIFHLAGAIMIAAGIVQWVVERK